jgi:hypothetical protein
MTKKLRDEADDVTSIRQYLIVDRLIAGCHRGSLDLKDGRTYPYLKGVSDSFGCDHRLQLIVDTYSMPSSKGLKRMNGRDGQI